MEFTTRFGLHSQTTRLEGRPGELPYMSEPPPVRAFHPLWAKSSDHTQCWTSSGVAIPLVDLNTTLPNSKAAAGFGAGLFPLHSPLLGESWLVSFPPLSDMLKFSG